MLMCVRVCVWVCVCVCVCVCGWRGAYDKTEYTISLTRLLYLLFLCFGFYIFLVFLFWFYFDFGFCYDFFPIYSFQNENDYHMMYDLVQKQ